MNSVEAEVKKVVASIEALSEKVRKAEGHLNNAQEAGDGEAVRLWLQQLAALQQQLAALQQQLAALQHRENLLLEKEARLQTAGSADDIASRLDAILGGQGMIDQKLDKLVVAVPLLSGPVLRQLAGGSIKSDDRNELQKDKIISYYNAADPTSPHRVLCCVTGRYLDKHMITGAHIVPVSSPEFMELVGLKDVNALRNTAPWCKAFEKARHDYKVCFDSSYTVHILDDDIRPVCLEDYAPDTYAKREDNLGDLTFNDLDGVQMSFNNDRRPMKRCLVLMASAAVRFQKGSGKLSLRVPITDMSTSPYENESQLKGWIDCLLPNGWPEVDDCPTGLESEASDSVSEASTTESPLVSD